MPEYHFENTDVCREVETIYDAGQAQRFREQGRKCLQRSIFWKPEFTKKRLKVQSSISGEVKDIPESRKIIMQYTCQHVYFDPSEWVTIKEYLDYPRTKPEGLSEGFYIIPEDPKIGERLYISNLLEDFLVTEFWETIFIASSGFGIWTGSDLEIETSYFDSVHMVG
jgi:hypothetical protein